MELGILDRILIYIKDTSFFSRSSKRATPRRGKCDRMKTLPKKKIKKIKKRVPPPFPMKKKMKKKKKKGRGGMVFFVLVGLIFRLLLSDAAYLFSLSLRLMIMITILFSPPGRRAPLPPASCTS